MTLHFYLVSISFHRCRCVKGVEEEGGVIWRLHGRRAQFEVLRLHRDIMRSLLPLLSVLYIGTKGAEVLEHNMPFMEYLDQDHLVCLKWGFNDPTGSITFKLVVNTTGWVGFGFSPNGGMQGSDIVMGGFRSGGSYFAVRHY